MQAHRLVQHADLDIKAFDSPFSSFDYVEDAFLGSSAIHRCFSLARSFSAQSMVVEAIPPVGLIAQENDELDRLGLSSVELKDFQKESLGRLDAFLRAARAGTLTGAFEQVAKNDRPDLFRPYRPLTDATADAPFVCLRLPTGGGKTILAAHAVKVVAEAWMCTDSPLVLWLVPTSMIRDQTLKAVL